MFKNIALFFSVLWEKLKDPFDISFDEEDIEEDSDDAVDDEVEKQTTEIFENLLKRRARRPD